MSLTHLTNKNFDDVVLNNSIVFIDFWAEWCAPCKAFKETLLSVASQYPDIVFGQVNIEEETELSEDFDVRSIPALMIIKDRTAIYFETGTMPPSALTELIEQTLKTVVDPNAS